MEWEAAAAEEANQSCRQELRDGQSEAAFLRRALEEGAEVNAGLQSRVFEISSAHDRLFAECAALQRGFRAEEEEASQLQILAARAELRASREEGGRLEAEARRDCLQVELSVAEGRLINRGTHVDLLLRDKERLWGQLARARRGTCTNDESKEPPSTPQKDDVATGRPAGASGRVRPRSAAGSACSTPTKGPHRRSPSASAGNESKTPAPQEERCLELERQLWHTQRALERERAGHEQAREALRVRGWRADKPLSRDAARREEDGRSSVCKATPIQSV